MSKKRKAEVLYKVLVNGSSCHGGSLDWSLPGGDGKPGDWHEEKRPLILCKVGIHLTDDPARWYKPDCKVYLVEAEGVLGACSDNADRKVVARRVRLLKELSEAELIPLRIFYSGQHTVKGNGTRAVAAGSSSVEARDSSRVVARGSSRVVAWGSSSVVAWDSSSVEAWDSSSVEAWDSSSVEAWDSSRVVARGSSSVVAWGSSSVEARGSSSVEAWDSSSVVARGSSSVEAGGDVTVVSWKGKDGIKVTERAVAVVRDCHAQPRIVVAKKASTKKRTKK